MQSKPPRKHVRGVHGARTLMIDQFLTLLGAVGPGGDAEEYAAAIIDRNVLAKATYTTRRETLRRLAGLYLLTPTTAEFRLFRFFYGRATVSQPILAGILALPRDPVFADSVPFVREKARGERCGAHEFLGFLERSSAQDFGPKTIGSASRNLSGTWSQVGFLSGRAEKLRVQPPVDVAAVGYAVAAALLRGTKGKALLGTPEVALLDRPEPEVRTLLTECHARGWITYRALGDVVDVTLDPLRDPCALGGAA